MDGGIATIIDAAVSEFQPSHIAAQGLRRNPVVDKLHRSGECLCGALAHPEEIREIEVWYPAEAKRIHDLEEECFKRGLPSEWGSRRQGMPPANQATMELCQSCETRWDVLRRVAGGKQWRED